MGILYHWLTINQAMPNTKSAAKAHRQSTKRRARSLATSKSYKNILKDFRKAASTEPKKAVEILAKLQQKLDKAAKLGVIAKNKASRLKSGAAKLLAKAAK
jgi:small subunit ribosomal protein S20